MSNNTILDQSLSMKHECSNVEIFSDILSVIEDNNNNPSRSQWCCVVWSLHAKGMNFELKNRSENSLARRQGPSATGVHSLTNYHPSAATLLARPRKSIVGQRFFRVCWNKKKKKKTVDACSRKRRFFLNDDLHFSFLLRNNYVYIYLSDKAKALVSNHSFEQ